MFLAILAAYGAGVLTVMGLQVLARRRARGGSTTPTPIPFCSLGMREQRRAGVMDILKMEARAQSHGQR